MKFCIYRLMVLITSISYFVYSINLRGKMGNTLCHVKSELRK